ncbi:amino acid ABC transporter permease [Paenibacillus sediminis]|uniref:His/Glu/Gln/Arg/opine family amino acid ABC transporter permease subunit n=1 Tax=Paenibacillus sediminis TaxID=664909 RepID=A0ABS4H094_9BACL|nr:amino acid ABC transporter permease [Paenibacillus sediminis]MBP1935955.1 His/Glu/Gln/Arg/opine family amino acid ABC transporter permease subunit [Paenibacillus sediminis]
MGLYSFFVENIDYYITGVKYTLLLSVVAVVLGFILGAVFALMRLSSIKVLSWIAAVYIEFLRGTPLLVQLLIIHYGLSIYGINFPPLVSGSIALFINSSAYLAEVFRAGIQGVDRGQMEAARSLGMTKGMATRHIILPQAIKAVLPAIGNEFIVIIKESSIVSIIGVMEIMYNAEVLRGSLFEPMKPLLIAAIIYFIMTFSLSKLLGVFERKLKTSD